MLARRAEVCKQHLVKFLLTLRSRISLVHTDATQRLLNKTRSGGFQHAEERTRTPKIGQRSNTQTVRREVAVLHNAVAQELVFTR